MRVAIFHGYLLRGTGSNVYNANLARALADLGHRVELVCQERDWRELDWLRERADLITVHTPDIGRLLPVYVEDHYEHFEARAYPRLSDSQIATYIEANVGAVAALAHDAPIEAALANHLIMGPLICARAGLPYAVKIHGSALSYTVKPDRKRFGPYGREGLLGARGVLVGSGHTARSLFETYPDLPELPAKTRLGPPGVETELFAPVAPPQRRRALHRLAERAEASSEAGFGRDGARAAAALRRYADAEGPRVAFVGKLIVSKGVDLLLAAWPFVHAAHPGARLLLAGFGEYRAGVERIVAALAAADLAPLRALAAEGRGAEGGRAAPLPLLSAFLACPPDAWLAAAPAAANAVDLSGRLSHDEVGPLLGASDALVFPSTFPEAFGMVAAEAAAAGALPICADHSGISEVVAGLVEPLDPAVAPLLSFRLDGAVVEAIASRLLDWLATPAADRAAVARSLRAVAARKWGWEGVARGVISASAGRLDGLPPLP